MRRGAVSRGAVSRGAVSRGAVSRGDAEIAAPPAEALRRREFTASLGLGLAALWAPLVASGLGLASGVSCLPEDQLDVRRRLLRSWTQQLAVAEYQAAADASVELKRRAEALRADPSPAALEAARAAWQLSRAPIKRAELFAFGPYLEEPERYGPQLDFWPLRPAVIDSVLSGSSRLSAAAVAALGAPARGLPAIEYLLWAPGVDAERFRTETRRADYLVALAADLGRVCAALVDAWQGHFAEQISEAGELSSALYPSLLAAFGDVVNRAGVLIEHIRGDKLGKPLGEASGGVAQPAKAESQYSGRSVQDILDNLEGVRRMFFGAEQPEVIGLERYLSRLKPELVPRVREGLAACVTALGQVSSPLTAAVIDDPSAVRDAERALGELQRLIQADVLGALSVSVGFSGNDGD